ncbi:hypothetical protein QBC33DRAFT_559510 [Phialemonium atrogriseum]|uniref:Hikeshi-like domain-containing protein n=1 Tax=Phialemonium atrogriseum TaxID=1093897 RepID=A0AAJ0FFP3_9PEZI|nr:uncharacterized protein QBC33DRAFT_559510 [Phialemonium atrogriseum]KAK1766781.1 hypothetical protein QBC33DRAFT_559510 [Phialemonium atrogriseum]
MSQPAFGIVPAGQPVITTPTEAPSPTSFLYAIPQGGPGSTAGAAKPFSHIVVFLLPGVALPPDTAAAIYLVTPGPPGHATPTSRFLGGVGPGKESAIFNLGPSSSSSSSPYSPPSSSSSPIVIGISLEPAESVAQRIAERSAASSSAGAATSGAVVARPSTLVLAQRIIRNAFNFLAGFSGQAGQVEVVPLKAFEDWWRKFESRLRTDPGFLERED